MKFSIFPINMPIETAIVPVSFMKSFPGKIVSPQTSDSLAPKVFLAPTLWCLLSDRCRGYGIHLGLAFPQSFDLSSYGSQ